MYVFQILADAVFGVVSTTTSNYQVSSSAGSDLVRDVPRENEMSVGPFNENLIHR